MAKKALRVLVEWPELDLRTYLRLKARKVLNSAGEPCIDIRIHQRYPDNEGFTRTKRGLFMPEREWMLAIPYLMECLGYNHSGASNGKLVA